MGSGGALRRAKGCGAWRGPRGFGFYFEGHRQSAGRAPSSFQRVTPTAAGNAQGGGGRAQMGSRSGPGRWEGSDSKHILKVKPVRFPDESERSIKEKAPGWPGLLHGNSGNDLAAGWEGGPGSEGLSEAPASRS